MAVLYPFTSFRPRNTAAGQLASAVSGSLGTVDLPLLSHLCRRRMIKTRGVRAFIGSRCRILCIP